jgi:hypothetical protein
MRQATASLLGAVIADAPVSKDPPPESAARAHRLSEGEKLIVPAADRLLAIQAKMGPRMRAFVVPAAMQRAVHIFEQWQALDPSEDHAKSMEVWKTRLAEAKAASEAPAIK